MKISTVRHSFTDALKSLVRNRTLSVAAITTVTATLFVLGIFIMTILDVGKVVEDVQSKVEVKIFLKNDILINDEMNLENTLRDIPGVKEVNYESKEKALENLKTQFGKENEVLAEGIDKEEMPSSFVVKVEKPEIISNVVSKVKEMPGIDKIRDERQLVDTIVKVISTIKWVGIVLFAILIGVSLFLIGNTIKITVYSRRKEIGIMKYIGATDWYIRWPFIMEGMVIGIIGGIISTGIVYWAYTAVFNKVSAGMMYMQLVNPSYIYSSLIWAFLGGGLVIGALGSVIAIRKFLVV